MCIPIVENPSCLQTTLASDVLQESSHTVPHVLLLQSSTRPSYRFVPPRSLISPLVHGSEWCQIEFACKENPRSFVLKAFVSSSLYVSRYLDERLCQINFVSIASAVSVIRKQITGLSSALCSIQSCAEWIITCIHNSINHNYCGSEQPHNLCEKSVQSGHLM